MEHELTKGPVMKTMLLFAVPMILEICFSNATISLTH